MGFAEKVFEFFFCLRSCFRRYLINKVFSLFLYLPPTARYRAKCGQFQTACVKQYRCNVGIKIYAFFRQNVGVKNKIVTSCPAIFFKYS